MTVKEIKPPPTIYIGFVLLNYPLKSLAELIQAEFAIKGKYHVNHKFVIALGKIAMKQ